MEFPALTSRKRLRLYVVRDPRGRLLMTTEGQVAYFGSKRRAKAARNQATALTGLKHRVSRGPDNEE